MRVWDGQKSENRLETGKKVMKDYEVYVGAKAGFRNFFEAAAKEAVKVSLVLSRMYCL